MVQHLPAKAHSSKGDSCLDSSHLYSSAMQGVSPSHRLRKNQVTHDFTREARVRSGDENTDRSTALWRQPYLVNFCIFNYWQFPGLFKEKARGSYVILDRPKALHGSSKMMPAHVHQSYLEYLERVWERYGREAAHSSFQATGVNSGIT